MPALARMKELLGQHGDKVENAIDKAASTVDRRTNGQHRTNIEKGVRSLKGYLRDQGGPGTKADRPR